MQMETKIREQIKLIINNEIDNSDAKKNYIEIINKLRNEDFVKKKDLLSSMVDYMNLIESKLNGYLEASFRMAINYEVLKETNDQYKNYFELVENESKEVSEMMDKQDYPKSTKPENITKYNEMLKRHEQEINTLT